MPDESILYTVFGGILAAGTLVWLLALRSHARVFGREGVPAVKTGDVDVPGAPGEVSRALARALASGVEGLDLPHTVGTGLSP